jgi:hypothetical protein
MIQRENPEVWITRIQPHLAYRAMPKCGCSSLGQVLHYFDFGIFFSHNIHDAGAPLLKWKSAGGPAAIRKILESHNAFRFTFVRNPYARLLSTFAEKIAGFQSSGRRYRGGFIHTLLQEYGVRWGPKADLVRNFKGFIAFVADTIDRQQPIAPDLHWTSCAAHMLNDTVLDPDWQLDFIGHIESMEDDLRTVARMAGADLSRFPSRVPRENASALPKIGIETFYGPQEIAIMQRIYADDFRLFRYSPSLGMLKPLGAIDTEEVNRYLDPIRQTVPAET